jgi:CRISPR-associated protein Cmr4
MKTHLFSIECLTNLHVGSGESNYNIIDNEVERDPVLENVPVIHASGVKGALRAHCKDLGDNFVKSVFGDEGDTGRGAYKFFAAGLLARPLRVSQGSKSYVLATTEEVLRQAQTLAKGLGAELQFSLEITGSATLEGDAQPLIKPGTALFGEDAIALVPSFEAYDLPVLARNCLEENNRNLWYEEIVPYTSRFYFFVLAPDDARDYAEFKEKLEGAAVQFGGNASIGYGYCTVKEVPLP